MELPGFWSQIYVSAILRLATEKVGGFRKIIKPL